MNLSSETSGAIEAALDQFEEQWLRGPTPPDIVSAVTGLQQLTGFAEQRVAWELAMSDLELRWRQADPMLRRTCRWYAEHLGPFGLNETDVAELSTHEMIVRSRWGDRPDLVDLLDEQFPGIRGQARRRQLCRLVSQIDEHFPVQCVVKVDGATRFRSKVPTPCIFGRQRSCDPAAGGAHLDSETGVWRMIVAERRQNRISRDQFLVRRLAVHRISVESLSENVGCYLADRRLPAERPVVLDVVSRSQDLRFHNVTVRFFSC